MPGYLGTKEVAKRLGKNQSTISAMCREGKIPGAEQDAQGSPWRIPEESIEKILNQRKKV